MKYEIKFTPNALEDIKFWKKSNPNIIKKIKKLIDNMSETPFQGLGKPEPLKYELHGKYSRRIDSEHRLVYEVCENIIIIHSCRYHYNQ